MKKENLEKVKREIERTERKLDHFNIDIESNDVLKNLWVELKRNMYLVQFCMEEIEKNTNWKEPRYHNWMVIHRWKSLALAYGLNENAKRYAIECMKHMPDFSKIPKLNIPDEIGTTSHKKDRKEV